MRGPGGAYVLTGLFRDVKLFETEELSGWVVGGELGWVVREEVVVLLRCVFLKWDYYVWRWHGFSNTGLDCVGSGPTGTECSVPTLSAHSDCLHDVPRC